MKAITAYEVEAIRNEVESNRRTARSNLANLKGSYGLSKDAINWINGVGGIEFDQLDSIDQRSVLDAIYDASLSKSREGYDIAFICDFLRATQVPRYVEVADKLAKISQAHTDKEKIEMARAVMNSSYSPNGKNVSLNKEVNEIKSRYKKVSKKETKIIKKFANIDNLYFNFSNLKNSIISFINNNKGNYLGSQIRNYQLYHNLEEFVYEHQYEVIDMLDQCEDLSFMSSQKTGKIR